MCFFFNWMLIFLEMRMEIYFAGPSKNRIKQIFNWKTKNEHSTKSKLQSIILDFKQKSLGTTQIFL